MTIALQTVQGQPLRLLEVQHVAPTQVPYSQHANSNDIATGQVTQCHVVGLAAIRG